MKLSRLAGTVLLATALTGAAATPPPPSAKPPDRRYIEAWLGARLREPSDWFASAEAARIADNVLVYQRDNGGWPKGKDLHRTIPDREKAALQKQKGLSDTTLDNGGTHTQIWFLAKVQQANPQPRFREAILRGLDWLFAAQYPNGGWPQCWPDFVHTNQRDVPGLKVSRRNPEGLTRFITFNDEVMIGALRVLDAVARAKPLFALVDAPRRRRAVDAVARGIACILRCQVRVDGTLTVWAGQHDEKTLQPRWARTFEPVALTAFESVGIVEFLMEIDHPAPEVVAAIDAAMAWFERTRVRGIRTERRTVATSPRGFDVVVIPDPSGPGLWARYYEIATSRPIFGDHDDEAHATYNEISIERRTGYAWYGAWPEELLRRQYPEWKKRRPAGSR
jgi:PelA/Pel-15E family pectate lyase